MLIDENKIQELVKKEIKEQVEKKLKLIGRETILNIYKNQIHDIVSKELRNKENEFTKITIKAFEEDKEWIRAEVADRTANKLMDYFIDGVQGENY